MWVGMGGRAQRRQPCDDEGRSLNIAARVGQGTLLRVALASTLGAPSIQAHDDDVDAAVQWAPVLQLRRQGRSLQLGCPSATGTATMKHATTLNKRQRVQCLGSKEYFWKLIVDAKSYM